MQSSLHKFFSALRSADVRVSPAEAIDASRAVARVGYGDRKLLRDALCVSLAKTQEEVEKFSQCFEIYFTREEFRNHREPNSPDAHSQESKGQRLNIDDPLAKLLLSDDRDALALEMESAANDVGANDIRFFTQRGFFARRILDQMGLRDIERIISSNLSSPSNNGLELSERLEEGRRWLLNEARRYMDRQYELYAKSNGELLRDEFLAETRLGAIEPRDFDRMQRIVRRMAKRLESRYSRRLKRARRGRLDVARTIRNSLPLDGVPFETVWKQERIEKPKIVAICDVSRSVASAARFLLLFLYSLNQVVAKLSSYAFSDGLIAISDIMEEMEVEDAIVEIMRLIGFRSTDYGKMLMDFDRDFSREIDRKTTVIILGDGRSNYTEPRVELIRRLHDRSKLVIWLNPEPESFWGQGDSEMDRYRPFCHVVKTCNTVKDLEKVVDIVLKSYLPF